jgi:2-C-methyl-D-erythritol 4-phosphate cytidylyltransferase
MTQALWVIIPAAGVGQRMQADCPKQYLSLAGQSILDRTIAIFLTHPFVAGVLVGIGKDDAYWTESKWTNHVGVHTFMGGTERSDTVQKGLEFLLSIADGLQQEVLVHDAARPLLTHEALDRIIYHDSEHGSLLAMPARDTVKSQLSGTSSVEKTLDRNSIWLAQTPQKFPLDKLLKALQTAKKQGVSVTDECSAMELIGYHPDFLLGESSNIKITLPEDLLIAEALFSYLSSSNTQCR